MAHDSHRVPLAACQVTRCTIFRVVDISPPRTGRLVYYTDNAFPTLAGGPITIAAMTQEPLWILESLTMTHRYT
ncbi:hypothetical protein CDL15_Pgr002732 [Punica granatum]|uniref:Uncharacterized protein n=1 Tax=Punica granatum TaxID=22663 RepID=A0A218X077_PUNGR|nr:hypothetical protein CDL15_Pgr002732 [Punica granatum]